MVGSKWVSGSGLVLDMNPTVVNVVVDVLFALLFAITSSVASHTLVAVRKKAIIRADPRNLPLGRFDLVEVIKEWFAIRSGNQNKSVYGTVVMVSVLLSLAHPVADSGLTFNKHAMGDMVPIVKHYLMDEREGIVFRRNAEPGLWDGIKTETEILEESEIDDPHLYKKAVRAANKFSDIHSCPGVYGAVRYPGVFQGFPNGRLVAVPGDPEILANWHEADWLKQQLPKLVANVTKGKRDRKQVRFHVHAHTVSVNLLHGSGYDHPSSCIVEDIHSGIKGKPGVTILCRKVQGHQSHHYLVMVLVCSKTSNTGSVSFHTCRLYSEIGLVAEIEETVKDGRLSFVPLPVLASFMGTTGNSRQPGQTFMDTVLHGIRAARFYNARWVKVQQREDIVRPEIKLRLMIILGGHILLILGILLWKWAYMRHIKQINYHVAAAHVPSYAYEWALKARNEELKEWPCAESKPKNVTISPFFGVVHTNGQADRLGIAAHPQPSEGKPFRKLDAGDDTP